MFSKDWSELKTGWSIILACAVGVGSGLSAILFYTFGVFSVALEDNFGWSRRDIQFGVTIYSTCVILILPFIGIMLDKYGARKIALTSLVTFTLFFSSFGLIGSNILSFYVVLILIALLSAGSMPITYTRVINTWFNKRRGIALGIMLSGTGLVATFSPSAASYLIEIIGWRLAYPVIGLTLLISAFPLLYILLKEKSDLKEEGNFSANKYQKIAEKKETEQLSDRLTGYNFCALAISMASINFAVGGMVPNIVPMLADKGYELSTAAGYVGLIGVAVISGRILVGLFLDYFHPPLVACCCTIPITASCIMLASNTISPIEIIISVIMIGLAAGAEYDLLAYLVSRLFKLKSYGRIYGLQYIFFGLAAAVAPVIFGYNYDIYQNYQKILYITGSLTFAGSLIFLTLKFPDHYKENSDT